MASHASRLVHDYTRPPIHDARDFEFLLAGLERELTDGLARLKATDSAEDHVNWYRDQFLAEVRELRQALDRVGPLGYDVACHAWQAAFLARIWPWLKGERGRLRATRTFTTGNQSRQTSAALQRTRCRAIAKASSQPTATQIQHIYALRFPTERTPAVRSISRYLQPRKK